MNSIKFGILIVSDSCYKGDSTDKSGPELVNLLTDDQNEIQKLFKAEISFVNVVPDDESAIKTHLISWSNGNAVDVILTLGGTGFSDRDVTPEATRKVIDKEAPGLSLAMLMTSLKITPMAALSRAICGIRNKTLIINLPGSPKAGRECFAAIAPVLPHAVDLIRDDITSVKHVHQNLESLSACGSSTRAERNKSKLNLEYLAKRNRKSEYPMISVANASEIMYKYLQRKEFEVVDIDRAYGRVLVTDLHSNYDLPPFRASIKDGYAVIVSDGAGRRKVLGGIKAGISEISHTVVPGTCMRVNTGAPIPDGATAVVQVEDTKIVASTPDFKEETEIEIMLCPRHGQDIRPIGSDIQKNELILKSHTKLGAAELGLLAACGYKEVSVYKLPKVGVLSTGDEVQCPGKPLMPGKIYDSNKITLLSTLRENGIEPIDLGICQDDETAMVRQIELALKQVDVLVTSGSVSMGDKDMLKPILQHCFDATIHFGRVNMKPGKPTTFATCNYDDKIKYLFCLPGNPVSATVTMHLFVSPFVKSLYGDDSNYVIVKAKLTSSYDLDPRPEYARAILKWDSSDGIPKAYTTGNQISSKLLSCKNANALLMLPSASNGKPSLHAGDIVDAMLLGVAQRG